MAKTGNSKKTAVKPLRTDKMGLTGYISKATSPYGAVSEGRRLLEEAGFEELKLDEDFIIEKGKNYYLVPAGTELIAFTVGSQAGSIRMAAAHTDYPCLHIKPVAELVRCGYMRVNCEIYGSPILNTWLDRPLSVAGRVMLKGSGDFDIKTADVDFKRSVLTIPNLAIHYNREVNKGVELSKQNDMLPILGMLDETLNANSYFLDFLADEIKVKKEDILDFDLYVYNAEEPVFTGMKGELLSSPRLDNQTSCYALLEGIIESGKAGSGKGINICALFDNEEIGSRTRQGADSQLLKSILVRVYSALNMSLAELEKDIAGGFLLSVDVAHALHPAKAEKYDPVNNMCMGEGVTFKLSANQRYNYDSVAVAMLQQLAEAAGVRYRKFVNNSDMAGGGTLGPIISSLLPMRTVDIGVPILAMHSARELMAAADQLELEKLMKAYYLRK